MCAPVCQRKSCFSNESLVRPPGPGESEAEGERGAGETAGPARALQEVFDAPEHSLGQEPSERAHTEVTSDTHSLTETPLTVKDQ